MIRLIRNCYNCMNFFEDYESYCMAENKLSDEELHKHFIKCEEFCPYFKHDWDGGLLYFKEQYPELMKRLEQIKDSDEDLDFSELAGNDEDLRKVVWYYFEYLLAKKVGDYEPVINPIAIPPIQE